MTQNKSKTKTIKVDYLARVEGEGALFVKYDDNGVQDVKLKIFEPPRFFEAFLRGRDYMESPDITSRICGICPVAYQMSAVHAMENALNITPSSKIRELRRLIYCGEWIESHILHIYMLHAPDFLGYDSAVLMAKDHPKVIERGLRLKKAGNAIVALLGGREVHPINIRVGGFYRIPEARELLSLKEELKWGRDAAKETVLWTAGFDFPDFERDYEFVSLVHEHEYPLNEGRLISNQGLNISPIEYDNYFLETHVEHTNALHSSIIGRGAYLAGPLARYNLNFDKLSPLTQDVANEIQFSTYCRNPFQSIIVRSLEVLYAFDEALRILEQYEKLDLSPKHSPAQSYVEAPITTKEATGYAITEAPRGLLYHRYSIDSNGKITDAKIVPPTSQNQQTIENDLKELVTKSLHLPESELTRRCEQAIRNYDPCISCSTHFLKLHLEKA